MLKIGDFSRLSRISVRMLRYYDEQGLLQPERTDPFTGYRYYDEGQLAVAGRIAAWRDMGFGLAAIAQLIACTDTAQVEEHLLSHRRMLEGQRQQIDRQLHLVDAERKRIRTGGTMNHPVTIKTIPERYVASVRMTLPRYEEEGRLWSMLMSETAPLHLAQDPQYPPYTLFHDREHKDSDVDEEVQMPVCGQYEDTEHVRFKTMPAVTVASTIHRGGYSAMGDAIAAAAAWVGQNGYAFSGPAFFVYHVGPHETRDPEAFVTEICYPVERK